MYNTTTRTPNCTETEMPQSGKDNTRRYNNNQDNNIE